MTFNGHIGGDQVGYRVNKSNSGDNVHQMLLNSQFETNAGNGRLLSFLARHADVSERDYVDSRVRLRCRLPRAFARRLTIDEDDLLPDSTVTWLNGDAVRIESSVSP